MNRRQRIRTHVVLGVLACLHVAACGRPVPVTPESRLELALEQLRQAKTRTDRFHALSEAALQSFELGRLEEAAGHARTLLELAVDSRDDWNYGNAVHDGNVVLGRLALKEGRVSEAKERLAEAGRTPGSPQLNTFGPNMSLARDLLEAGEREAVLAYLEDSRSFWEYDDGELDLWIESIRAGRMPDFGANLEY
jgi:hypothetical protein